MIDLVAGKGSNDKGNIIGRVWIRTTQNIEDAFNKMGNNEGLEYFHDIGQLKKSVSQWIVREVGRDKAASKEHINNDDKERSPFQWKDKLAAKPTEQYLYLDKLL